MSGTEVVGACDTMNPPCHRPRHGLEGILGAAAWERLPRAVRARFGEPVLAVDYVGEFEIVRASLLGRLLAWLCQLIGAPVVPRTGRHAGGEAPGTAVHAAGCVRARRGIAFREPRLLFRAGRATLSRPCLAHQNTAARVAL